MSKKKKNSNQDNKTLQTIVLITAIINLIRAIIEITEKIIIKILE